MAGSKLHSVNIRVDGENPEAVEAMRLLIADAFEYLLSAQGKTELSTKDKYKGNGLARMTAVLDETYIQDIHQHYKKGE
jgi:hypothetical protein